MNSNHKILKKKFVNCEKNATKYKNKEIRLFFFLYNFNTDLEGGTTMRRREKN